MEPLTLTLPPALVEALAVTVCDELERRGALCPAGGAPSPWLDVDEAAAYMRCARQRLYDLVSAGTIEPARDGRRLLFRREALDAYLTGVAVENVRELRSAA